MFKSEIVGYRIFGSRFFNHVKHNANPDAYEKSRIVVQGSNDKSDALAYETILQRESHQVQLLLCTSNSGIKEFLHVVFQPYVQSTTIISRTISIKPSSTLSLPQEILFRVNCSHYGIPEADNYWFFTYHSHHKRTLNFSPSIFNPIFSTRRKACRQNPA